MKKNNLLLIAFFIVNIYTSKAQNIADSWFKYELTQNSYSKYNVNYEEEYNKVLKYNFDVKHRAEDIDKFAQIMANAKLEALKYNNIYYNLDGMEKYLQSVLNKLIPLNLKNKSDFKIYINREPDFNAFAIHDGSFFINIGALAYLNSESELAALIGHELAHYINNDSKEYFFERIKGESYINRSLIIPSILKNLKSLEFSRAQEVAADSLGLILISNAGYDPYAMVRLANVLLKLDKEYQLVFNKKYSISRDLVSTHPHAIDRVENSKRLIKNLNLQNGQTTIINSSDFEFYKNIGKQEQINLMFENHMIIDALKICFKNLLIQPSNKTYVSKSIELIQKLSNIFPNIIDEGFLTSQFEHNYFKTNEGIFKNLHYLFVDDSVLVNNLNQNSSIVNNKSLQTYNDFMLFFENQYDVNNSIEPSLYLAMYFKEKNTDKFNKYINLYLSNSKSLYKEYASALKNDKLDLNGKRNVYVCKNVSYIIKKFKGYYPQNIFIYENSEIIKSSIEQGLKSMDNNNELYFQLTDFENSNSTFYDYNKLYELSSSGLNPYNFNISTYSPEMWTYFKQNNIKNINFLEINHLKRKTRNYENYLLCTPFATGIALSIKITRATWVRLFTGKPSYKNQSIVSYISLEPSTKNINVTYQDLYIVGQFNENHLRRIFTKSSRKISNLRKRIVLNN